MQPKLALRRTEAIVFRTATQEQTNESGGGSFKGLRLDAGESLIRR